MANTIAREFDESILEVLFTFLILLKYFFNVYYIILSIECKEVEVFPNSSIMAVIDIFRTETMKDLTKFNK